MLVMLFASWKDRVGDIRDYHHGLLSLVDLLYIIRSAYEATTYMWSRDLVFGHWIITHSSYSWIHFGLFNILDAFILRDIPILNLFIIFNLSIVGNDSISAK